MFLKTDLTRKWGGYFFLVPYSPAPKFITLLVAESEFKPKSGSLHTFTSTPYVETPARLLMLLYNQLPAGGSSAL